MVGASLGTDAHTVGLDAILSLKGIAGDKGLEAYPAFRVVNLKSQVRPEDLAERAETEGADAVLVSQTVTQKDAHVHHLREFADAVDARGLRGRFLMIAGGPRLVPEMASELGYDRVFGKGTTPTEVASYLAWALVDGECAAMSELPEAVHADADVPGRRALRGRPGGRRADPGAVRRRGHRAVHPPRRRRGPVRGLRGGRRSWPRSTRGTSWRSPGASSRWATPAGRWTSRRCGTSSPRADVSDSAADVNEDPVVVCRATGTCVVKADRQRRG